MLEYFPENSNPEPSEARDDIWLDWAGFEAAAADFDLAAQRVAQAPSMDAFKALGGTCIACHDAFRD